MRHIQKGVLVVGMALPIALAAIAAVLVVGVIAGWTWGVDLMGESFGEE